MIQDNLTTYRIETFLVDLWALLMTYCMNVLMDLKRPVYIHWY